MIVLHKSTGILRCYLDVSYYWYRMVVDIDPGITDFYRSLVPKTVTLNKQRDLPHITVVRESYLPNVNLFKELNGLEVEFEYDYFTYYDDTYWWLPVIAPNLSRVRLALGLSPHSGYTRPPDDGSDIFHITIGSTIRI